MRYDVWGLCDRLLGVRKGDNLGVMLRNCEEFVEAFVAATALGARPFNVNYRYKEKELRYVLDNADARLLVCHPEYEGPVGAVRGGIPTLKHVLVCGRSAHGNLEWRDALARSSHSRPRPPWGQSDSRSEILFYTGGTTGMPKGVIWPQENIIRMIANNVSNALIKNLGLLATAPPPAPDNLLEMLDLPFRRVRPLSSMYLKTLSKPSVMNRAGDLIEKHALIPPGFAPLVRMLGKSFRLLLGSPLMHGAAWVGAVPTMSAAGSIYLLPDSPGFDPHSLWSTVEKERIKIVEIVGDAFAVPLLEALDEKEYDLGCVAVLATGAVRLSPYLKDRFHEKLPNAMIADTLLATEGGGAVSEASMSTLKKKEHRFKISSTGLYPVMVIDDEGNFVEPGSGKVGRLAYGGPQSTGYWKDPDKTAETYRVIGGDTWIVVGDLCTVEEDGTVNLIGREQACINSGGEKIFPYEIENILLSHPAVRDVAVIGIPHPRWGEAVTAVIELTAGFAERRGLEDELTRFMREELSDYKCPKHWVFLDCLGRSASGKLPYSTVRAMAIERLGIEQER